MKKIMFVCHGNICRSPMAEFLLRALAEKRGIEVFAASAATSREELGSSVHPGTKRKLREKGISCEGKRAVLLMAGDYDAYNYIFCMDSNNVRNALSIVGEDREGKVRRLLDITPHPRNIADPWYTGDFEETYRDVEEGCEALLDLLSGE